jgi:hypothetical protein
MFILRDLRFARLSIFVWGALVSAAKEAEDKLKAQAAQANAAKGGK